MQTTRTALITGASSGLGVEYAKLFAADQHDVVLVARSEDKLRALAAELEQQGVRAHVYPADLTLADAPRALFDALARDGVTVDVLVNNAGLGYVGTFHTSELSAELEMLHVNMTSLTALTHLFLPGMVARGYGRVLNIASTAAFQSGPGMSVYFATKAYVVSFSEGIAHELRGTGVTVTAHCPGATHTGFAAVAGAGDTLLFKGAVATADATARHGYLALRRGRVVSIHGLLNRLLYWGGLLTPRWLLVRITARMMK
jgi:hypothetical protein